MSKLRQICEQIPSEYRKEILELNVIDSAVASAGDKPMAYLVVVWKNYIEQHFEAECDKCRSRVLTNFRAMKKDLIELEKEANLLKTV